MSGAPSPKDNNNPDSKFFFDRHNFDDPNQPDEEDIPPPPVFSEEELAAEKAKSYEEGKQAGLDQSAASREQQIAATLDVIAENFSTLFAAEHIRETIFERESLALARQMLEVILPDLNAKYGDQEILPVVEQVLQTANQKSEITIEVPADFETDLNAFLEQKWPDTETRPRYRLVPGEDIQPGQCRMSWEDGGAIRDPGALIHKIHAEIDALLPRTEEKPEDNQDLPAESGDSPAPENNVIKEDQDSQEEPAAPDPSGENHE